MKFILKIFFWFILVGFFTISAALIGDYWGWMLWQKGLLIIGFIGVSLLAQWLWRRRRLKYHLKLLSISNVSVFDVNKAWQTGLAKWRHEHAFTPKQLRQKSWHVGFSFESLVGLGQYPSVSLESNSHNVSISLVAIDQTFILLFEFTSRLLLDREIELYNRYLEAFNKSFNKNLVGQLCFFQASALENIHESLLLDVSNNISKLNDALVRIIEKNLPITALLHRIEDTANFQDFWVRLARNVKLEAFGWQANELNFYQAEEWHDLKESIWQQLLTHCEKAFIHHATIGSIESYQFLAHIHQQLEQLQRLLQGDNNQAFSLSAIYWLSALENASSTKASPFSPKVFSQYLPCARVRANWIPKATLAAKQRLKMSLATYWLLMMTALVYVGFSYQTTTAVVLNQLQHFPKRVYFYNDPKQDINSLLMYQNILVELNAEQQDHWLSLFPYRAGIDRLQNAYRLSFINYFKRYALNPIDTRLQKNTLNNASLRPMIIMSIMYRLNLIDTKLLRLPIDTLQGPSVWLAQTDPANLFPLLYKTYIENNDNINALRQEQKNLLDIARQLNLEHENPQWLLSLIDQKNSDDAIYLNQIWGGSKEGVLANTQINPSYTLNGSLAIIDFWNNYLQAFSSIASLSKQQQTFYLWYQTLRYRQWHSFLLAFNQGYLTLNNQGEWDDTMTKIANEHQGPYQSIFKLINDQFSDSISQQSVVAEPSWLTLGKQFHLVLSYDLQNKRVVNTTEASSAMKNFVDYAKQTNVNQNNKNSLMGIYYNQIDFMQLAANDFYAYSQALRLLQNTVLQPEQAYLVSKAIYGGNNASFNDAMNKELTLENHFVRLHKQTNLFWELIKGPLEFYVRYSNLLSSNHVNDSWQLSVLAKTQNIPDMFLNNLLFGDNGIFWAFYNKYIGDYLIVRNNMVLPKFILGISYPFTPSFYSLINSAASSVSLAKQQTLYSQYFDKQTTNNAPTSSATATSATLPSINALPPLLNREATTLPQQITLNVECGKDHFELTNYNFPIEKPLTMPLSNCKKTNLTIVFSDFKLAKSYDNFLDFLDAIHDNTLSLSVADFPNDTSFLKQYHITALTLNYQLNHFDGLIEQYQNYLTLQKSLQAHQKNYASATDLPAVIVATNEEDQTSIREDLSISSEALWSSK